MELQIKHFIDLKQCFSISGTSTNGGTSIYDRWYVASLPRGPDAAAVPGLTPPEVEIAGMAAHQWQGEAG